MKQVVRKKVALANGVSNSKEIYSVIVDGTNLLKISLRNNTLNNDNGECYGAAVSFFRMLGDILRKKDFNHCHVCWDSEGSGVLRYNIYKDYKANRDKHYELYGGTSEYDKAMNAYVKKVLAYNRGQAVERRSGETDEESFNRQKSIIQQVLEELFVRQYEFDNVEGDDIIAYYVKNKKDSEKIVIVSTDRDLTQLISDDVCVWDPRKKIFITSKNSIDVLGITHENVVLQKIFCGDSSDNISGIKGMGESTFLKYFPDARANKSTIEAVVARSQELLDERKAAKKKPLKVLENVVNRITDGSQGDAIYEINSRIIDLSEPLLTDEAINELSEVLYAPMDISGRDINNVYAIINDNGMSYLQDERMFGEIFGNYNRIIEMEKRYSKEKNN